MACEKKEQKGKKQKQKKKKKQLKDEKLMSQKIYNFLARGTKLKKVRNENWNLKKKQEYNQNRMYSNIPLRASSISVKSLKNQVTLCRYFTQETNCDWAV